MNHSNLSRRLSYIYFNIMNDFFCGGYESSTERKATSGRPFLDTWKEERCKLEIINFLYLHTNRFWPRTGVRKTQREFCFNFRQRKISSKGITSMIQKFTLTVPWRLCTMRIKERHSTYSSVRWKEENTSGGCLAPRFINCHSSGIDITLRCHYTWMNTANN